MQKIVWEYYGINFNRVLEKILSIVNRLMLCNLFEIIQQLSLPFLKSSQVLLYRFYKFLIDSFT